MHAQFHRKESDFRATVARGALRSPHVVKMAPKPAPRLLVLVLFVIDCAALLAAVMAVTP